MMTYKTILLHVNDVDRIPGLVEAAAHLTIRFQAHLIGLHVTLPMPTDDATSYVGGVIVRGGETFRAMAESMRAAFEQATKRFSVIAEWRQIDAKHVGMAQTLTLECRAADLVIAGQTDRRWDHATALDEPETILMESGRPVLIIPHSGRFSSFGQRVTIAWNGRREAARAAFDALPLLKVADSVRVIWVNPRNEPGNLVDVPCSAIATALARHGVRCEAATTRVPDIKVSDALLSGLTDDSSDLLVMGAYGHSRLREFVLGGTTRQVLKHMTVPVLMSH